MSAAHTVAHVDLDYAATRWQRYLYDRRSTGAGVLAAARDAVANHHRASCGDEHVDVPDTFAGEVFARLYDDPAEVDQPTGEAPWATKAHEMLDGMPEWEALRGSVAGDPDFSAIAAASVLDQVAERFDELQQAVEEQAERGDQPAPNGLPTAEDKARAALRRAVAKAGDEVAETRTALGGLAPGLERVPPQHEQHDPRRMELAESLRRNPSIRDVLRRAGRIARIAGDRRKVRDEHARSEVVDLERGADLGRVLPSSLGRLLHPRARLLALRDLVERQALQYRLEGKEPLGRGPVVILVDVSGSMAGEPAAWAKAAAIALSTTALKERRYITALAFNGGVVDVVSIAPESGQDATMSLHHDRPIVDQIVGDVAAGIMRIASWGSSGGTQFAPPLEYAIGMIEQSEHRADVLFVTDGQANASVELVARVARAKADMGLRVFGLTVNGGSIATSMRDLCDELVDLDQTKDVAGAIASRMP